MLQAVEQSLRFQISTPTIENSHFLSILSEAFRSVSFEVDHQELNGINQTAFLIRIQHRDNSFQRQ
jgi:hypothetical protein